MRLTLPELAHMRLRLYPGGLWVTNPVAVADAVTSVADLRIAYAAARGRDLDRIDPTSGREPS